MSGRIVKVSGPLVVAEGMEDANMADVVRVGKQQLIGDAQPAELFAYGSPDFRGAFADAGGEHE